MSTPKSPSTPSGADYLDMVMKLDSSMVGKTLNPKLTATGSHWSTRVNHNTLMYQYRACTQCHCSVPAHYTHSCNVQNAVVLYQRTIHIQSHGVDQSEGRVRSPTARAPWRLLPPQSPPREARQRLYIRIPWWGRWRRRRRRRRRRCSANSTLA